MSLDAKNSMVAVARERFRHRYPELNPGAACLFWANLIIEVAAERGVKLCVQAGTLMWQRVPDELDDGVSPTHFSYKWEGFNGLNQWAVRSGRMPEMHVWAGCVETQSVIDLSVGWLPSQCKALTNLDWLTPEPPSYIWRPMDGLPKEVIYEPDADATILAGMMWDYQQRASGFVSRR